MISFIAVLFTLYNVSSTSPGYLETGNLTCDAYLENPTIKVVNSMEIELKYCDTCMISRELRSFHCKICGRCIRSHGNFINYFYLDHHCPWIANCVGLNNKKLFIYFLVSTLIHALILFISTLLIYLSIKDDANTFRKVLMLIVMGFGGFIVILMIIGISHQSYLISNNFTTNECLRSRLPRNLYDEGCRKNCLIVFG